MAGLSLKCEECGTHLKSVEEAQEHGELTGHSKFSESTEAVLNLICNTCGKPCRSRTESELHTKRTGHADFSDKTLEAAKPIDLEAPKALAADSEEGTASGESETQAQEMAVPEVDKNLLGELESMGFPTARATRALHYSGNTSLEAAVNWVVEHENDPDIDQMPMVPINIKVEDGKPSLTPEEVKLKAQELRERARKKKEEEEKRMEREREKERIRAGKELLEAKRIEEENERFLSMGFFDFQPQKRCLETLAYEEIRASEKEEENVPSQSTAFVLHGLLGSARNWRSFSRSLVSKIADSSSSTEWKMVLVDLRNHGRSAEIEGLDPPHDMVNAARDLANLVKFRGWSWPDVVIGHSMGGKVALQFAESCARGDYGESAALPKQLWVLDSVVGEVNPDDSDGEVEKVLKTLQSLPSSLPSRKWLVDHMMGLGFSKSLSEWIGSNLKKSDGHLTWAFNLQGAVEMFDSYREKSYWPLLEHPPEGLEISVVRAEGSDRWTPQVLQRLEGLAGKKHGSGKGNFLYHVLPNSGHWVHVDNPKGLLEIIAPDIISIG